MGKIKVLVADDHTILRQGIKSLLANEEEIEVIGEAKDGREALTIIEEALPDVILMDIAMPGLNGLEATRRIKKKFPRMKVLVLTMYTNEEYIFQNARNLEGWIINGSKKRRTFTKKQSSCS